jgi:hypothetical protein
MSLRKLKLSIYEVVTPGEEEGVIWNINEKSRVNVNSVYNSIHR